MCGRLSTQEPPDMACHPILAGLTPQQAQAAEQSGPILVLAGAGTGKTKTLTAAVGHRIAVRGIQAARILAVTFTNKAAGEMAGRIRATLGDAAAPYWIGTFHGLGARQLRIEPEVAGLRPGFDILDADDSRRVVKRVMKAMNVAGGDEAITIGRDPLKAICSRLSKFKDGLITPDDAPAHVEAMIAEAGRRGAPVDPDGLRASARVYAAYQRTLRDANAADFGDLLLWPARAMQVNAAYRERWAGRFDAVLADEYQDINHAQYVWLRMLAREHREIFAVGDDDQSVYSWRGSDLAYIRRFARDFPGAAQIKLEENFRSTGHILDAANAVIAQDRARLGKTLFTCQPDGDRIEVVRFRNADAEAAGIVGEMQCRHAEGISWDDMAVLYRSNQLSRGFEEALMRAGIPYVLIGRRRVLSACRDQGRAGAAATGRDTGRHAVRRGPAAGDQCSGARVRGQGDGDAGGGGGVAASVAVRCPGNRGPATQDALDRAGLRRCGARRWPGSGGDACRPDLAAAGRDRLPRHAAGEPGGDDRRAAGERAGADPARRQLPYRARTARPRGAVYRRSARGG